MRRTKNRAALSILTVLMLGTTGCDALQEGVSTGITDGFNAAVSAFIEAIFQQLADDITGGS
jgi:hypothetical protein